MGKQINGATIMFRDRLERCCSGPHPVQLGQRQRVNTKKIVAQNGLDRVNDSNNQVVTVVGTARKQDEVESETCAACTRNTFTASHDNDTALGRISESNNSPQLRAQCSVWYQSTRKGSSILDRRGLSGIHTFYTAHIRPGLHPCAALQAVRYFLELP